MSFILLESYDNYMAANLRLQQLEEEGIKAFLQDEYTVTIDPILSNAIGGIKLMVHEEDLTRAKSLMEELDAAYLKSFPCPRCGAPALQRVVETKKAVNWLSSLLSWSFASYAVPVSFAYKCFECGHEMKELPARPDIQENSL